jgi:hypothetical protein
VSESNASRSASPLLNVFYVVPAWSEQSGQCRIVSRQVEGRIDAAASYRATPELWTEAGLMNSRGKVVYLNDKHAFEEMSQDEPLMAGMQYSLPSEVEKNEFDLQTNRPRG